MHGDEVLENVSAIVFPNFISIHRGYWKSIRSVLQWHRPCRRYIINVVCIIHFITEHNPWTTPSKNLS